MQITRVAEISSLFTVMANSKILVQSTKVKLSNRVFPRVILSRRSSMRVNYMPYVGLLHFIYDY